MKNWNSDFLCLSHISLAFQLFLKSKLKTARLNRFSSLSSLFRFASLRNWISSFWSERFNFSVFNACLLSHHSTISTLHHLVVSSISCTNKWGIKLSWKKSMKSCVSLSSAHMMEWKTVNCFLNFLLARIWWKVNFLLVFHTRLTYFFFSSMYEVIYRVRDKFFLYVSLQKVFISPRNYPTKSYMHEKENDYIKINLWSVVWVVGSVWNAAHI